MNVFIINAHAEPKSFNAAMFRTAQETLSDAGHSVHVSDLYAMKFDPVSDRRNFTTVKDSEYFKQQIEEIHATEMRGWFGLPAILKGWVDRVFASGRTYGGDRFYENGVFKGKRALLSVTTGGPAQAYEVGGFNGDIHAILRPIHRGMLRLTGWDVLAPNIVYGPVRLSEEERLTTLNAWSARLRSIETEIPIDVGQY